MSSEKAAPQSMSEVREEDISPEEQRTFAILMQSIGEGAFHAKATDLLQEACEAVAEAAAENGGKPKAVLTLTVALEWDDGMIRVRGDAKAKLPAGKTLPSSIMYLTPNNKLTRRNPRQREMKFRDG